MSDDQATTNEVVAEHDAEAENVEQGNVDVPILDVRTPTSSYVGRDNIVPDGPGTIEDFLTP